MTSQLSKKHLQKPTSLSVSFPYQTYRLIFTNSNQDSGDSDHEGCVKAILSGLAQRAICKQQTFLIHLSGTGVISDERSQTWEGHSSPKIWDDIADIDEINKLPENAKHHKVDRWIQDAGNEFVKTVIVCPPDIYGEGYAVGGRTSFLVPMYVESLLKHKEAFYLGEGENLRAVAHIDDVVEVFLLLVGEALKGGGDAQWGQEVRTCPTVQSCRFGELIDFRVSISPSLMRCAGRMLLWLSAILGCNKAGCRKAQNQSLGML